jgi:hypothetical protein
VGNADCADSRHCSSGACVLDTCVAGSGSCDASVPAVHLCSAAGDRVLPVYCSPKATCQGEPGHAQCSDWICTPGQSTCNAAGQLETCAMDGLSVAAADCGSEQLCVGTRCVDIVCNPRTVSCNAETNSLHSCSADGTFDSVILCNLGQYCDVEAADCLAKTCVPGTEACVGDAHGVCDELGSGYGSLKACKANETCLNAACVLRVCDASDQFCGDDGNAYDCDSSGTIASLRQTCEAPGETNGAGGAAAEDYHQHCEKHGVSAGCYGDPCAKNQPYCELNQLLTCNAQGTGPVGAGTACGADSVCVAADVAHCAPKVCEPSARFCDADGNVRLCGADGSFSVAWDTCGAGLYCDAVDAYCKYETCTPSAAGCNGNVATTCKADGSSWEPTGTDCSLSTELCDAGICKPKICEPDSYFCTGGNAHYCSVLGTSSTVADSCDAAEYCADGYSYCLLDQCTGGKPVCADSTHLATCKADGSGPNGAGTACGANKTCDAGQCKTQVCTPNSTFCEGGHVQACDSSGLSYSQYTYCFADQYCKTVSSSAAACAPKVCTTGAKGCDGESYATCDALGSGYTDSPTLCTTSGKLCSLTGCAASAVDVIGDQSTSGYASGSYYFGDIIYVRTARKLTLLELDSASDLTGVSLHWAIYSGLKEGGPYAPVFDSFSVGTTAGIFQSSGPIAVTLTAGRYYVIGLRAESGMFVYRNNGVTPPLSFADQLGTTLEYADPGTLPPTFSEGNVGGSWHLRLTTTAAP